LEKATGAIIAGLFRQQLKMMVKNARDTIREEEKAEVKKKEEAKVAALRASAKDMQLDNAGNTNEEKNNAGNSDRGI
jgi:predicted ATPase with chaperone activity